ncbi:hypothetical protein M422DRAFT_239131 [Sphaerobolus stellatus SS14]|nr:hypothetical protein M422DRAFT_239131 [Sphaerobolus stellatus SS14]
MILPLPLQSPIIDPINDHILLNGGLENLLQVAEVQDSDNLLRRIALNQDISHLCHPKANTIVVAWLETVDLTVTPPKLRSQLLQYVSTRRRSSRFFHGSTVLQEYSCKHNAADPDSLTINTLNLDSPLSIPSPPVLSPLLSESPLSPQTPSTPTNRSQSVPPNTHISLPGPKRPTSAAPDIPTDWSALLGIRTPHANDHPISTPRPSPSPRTPNMTSTKVSPFSSAINENGYEWLKDIESFFMEAGWTDDLRRCEYFRLRLRGDADRRFNSFNDITKQWTEAYPAPAPEEITSETTELNTFKSLRLETSKLTDPITDKDGALTWETIRFVKTLRFYGDRILSMSDDSKGAEAYSHLQSIIQDRITPHSGSGLGPKLSTLCNDLLKLDHHDIARRIKEQTKERNDLQNQLNSLQLSIHRTPHTIPAPYPAYYTPTTNTPTFPLRRSLNGRQTLPYPAAIAPVVNVRNPPPNIIRLTSAPAPPIPTSFTNSTDSLKLYADAVRTWDTRYGRDTQPTIETKYPLTPGLPTPGSNECWCCGRTGHNRMDPTCNQNPPLPEKEQMYRRLVAMSSRTNPRPPTRTYATNFIESGIIPSGTTYDPTGYSNVHPIPTYDTPFTPSYESPMQPTIPLYHYKAMQHYPPHQQAYNLHFAQHEYPT